MWPGAVLAPVAAASAQPEQARVAASTRCSCRCSCLMGQQQYSLVSTAQAAIKFQQHPDLTRFLDQLIPVTSLWVTL